VNENAYSFSAAHPPFSFSGIRWIFKSPAYV
jgi:hypothetical protein